MAKKDKTISNPRYQKVAIGIAQRIVDGKFSVGQKIKSRSTISSYFNVSPETARKAINVLADLDIVSIRQGSGVVVVSKDKAAEFLQKFEVTFSLKEIKKDIQTSIARQKQELETIDKLTETFLSQATQLRKKFPFEPFELHLNKESDNLNKSLSELNLWHQTGATVVALKSKEELLLSPGPYATVRKDDTLYFVGDESSFVRMQHLFDIS
ncbi:GntR family transcriptional regulator [Streptococcus macacae]|uniref:Bacterial regulatory protein, GntR family n=1 Tax=Streptococcus macacae NCTC 11558 TaxID=764298 RepID=G5JUB7_9STRE|nr:GntR family transcriptional regulator [Streptococcus macacae]EHJ53132.1 bacterial regulatory protein, GntR family [Streptococcus macacae NCTC 11558]SUN78480.1 GntR family transcriptional regulator [Streptococcus macacae NCTC 11558]